MYRWQLGKCGHGQSAYREAETSHPRNLIDPTHGSRGEGSDQIGNKGFFEDRHGSSQRKIRASPTF